MIARLGSIAPEVEALSSRAYLPGKSYDYYRGVATEIGKAIASYSPGTESYDALNVALQTAGKNGLAAKKASEDLERQIAEADRAEVASYNARAGAKIEKEKNLDTAKKIALGVGVGLVILVALRRKRKE